MTKSKTISRPTTGGRFVRDKATGALEPEAEHKVKADEVSTSVSHTDTDAGALTPARKTKGS